MNFWKNIITPIYKRQTEKGVKEYGQTLEENEYISVEELLDMAMEESVDNLMYLAKAKHILSAKETTIKEPSYTYNELVSELELLKADIEWDKSLEYQIVLEKVIEILRQNPISESEYHEEKEKAFYEGHKLGFKAGEENKSKSLEKAFNSVFFAPSVWEIVKEKEKDNREV